MPRRKRKGSGRHCFWCGRIMAPNGQTGALEQTQDHVYPKSKGGKYTVNCCFTCNNMKGSMTPTQWGLFMKENPEWWKLSRAYVEIVKPKYLCADPVANQRCEPKPPSDKQRKVSNNVYTLDKQRK